MPRTGGTRARRSQTSADSGRSRRGPGRRRRRCHRPVRSSRSRMPNRSRSRCAAETAQRAVSRLAPRSRKVTGAPAARSTATIESGARSPREIACRLAGPVRDEGLARLRARRSTRPACAGTAASTRWPSRRSGRTRRTCARCRSRASLVDGGASMTRATSKSSSRSCHMAATTTEATPTWAPWRPVGTPVRMAAMSSRWLMACSAPDRGAVRPTAPSARPLRVIRSHSQASASGSRPATPAATRSSCSPSSRNVRRRPRHSHGRDPSGPRAASPREP